MPALVDGIYEVVVIDAREDDDGTLQLDLAVVSGAHKGEVVHLSGPRRDRDATAFLGLPATVRVHQGAPRLTFG
jgi:hypothetical protein